jgi:hypothetical protein
VAFDRRKAVVDLNRPGRLADTLCFTIRRIRRGEIAMPAKVKGFVSPQSWFVDAATSGKESHIKDARRIGGGSRGLILRDAARSQVYALRGLACVAAP